MNSCTIWFKTNDKFTGIVCNEGGILETGKILYENYSSSQRLKSLIDHGSIVRLEKNVNECINFQNGEDMIFKNLPYSQAQQVANMFTYGAYAYIWDEDASQWWLGMKMKLSLSQAINR